MIVQTHNHKYYLSGKQKDILLLPPLLAEAIEKDGNILSTSLSESDKDAIDYYQKKYALLKESGYFESAEPDSYEFITEDLLKQGIANSRQVVFETTERCNLKCKYCGYNDIYSTFEKRTKRELSFDKAKRFLDFMKEQWNSPLNVSYNKQIAISFYGGEPLMNFSLIEKVVDYVSKWKLDNNYIVFSMTTNGTLLDRYMDFLVNWNFTLFISIDGDKYHNSFRTYANGKESFEKVYNNITLIQQKYPDYFQKKVNFNSVFHKRSSYLEVSNFFQKAFGKSPLFLALNTFGVIEEKKDKFELLYKNPTETLDNESAYHPELKEQFSSLNIKLLSLLNCYHANLFPDYNALLYDVKNGIIPTGTCLPFQHKIYVSTSGKILPCEKVGSDFVMGQITDQEVAIDYAGIARYYNDKYQRVITELCSKCKNVFCKSCLFTMKEKEGKLQCGKFLSKNGFNRDLTSILSECEENPQIVTKLWDSLKQKEEA